MKSILCKDFPKHYIPQSMKSSFNHTKHWIQQIFVLISIDKYYFKKIMSGYNYWRLNGLLWLDLQGQTDKERELILGTEL